MALTAVRICMGCSYTDPTTKQKTFSQFWPASNAATDAMAYVLDDPFGVFQMQNASEGQTLRRQNEDGRRHSVSKK